VSSDRMYTACLCLNFYHSMPLGKYTKSSLVDIFHAEYLFVDTWLILLFTTFYSIPAFF
jgi:hypothetical protein